MAFKSAKRFKQRARMWQTNDEPRCGEMGRYIGRIVFAEKLRFSPTRTNFWAWTTGLATHQPRVERVRDERLNSEPRLLCAISRCIALICVSRVSLYCRPRKSDNITVADLGTHKWASCPRLSAVRAFREK